MAGITPEQAHAVWTTSPCLLPGTAIQAALDRMAEEITRVLAAADPLVLVVMQGGVIPAGQLLPRLDFPLRLDYVHATRYREQTRGGELHWLKSPPPLAGESVLILDDVLDEGITLAEIVSACYRQGAKQVYTAVVVEKRRPRQVPLVADFIGVRVEDKYLFGYGMDYKGYLRNANGIYAVD